MFYRKSKDCIVKLFHKYYSGYVMKDWLQVQLVRLILDFLTEDKIDDLALYLKSSIFPFLHEKKSELLGHLKEYAEVTETQLDDIMIEKLEDFIDAFLPDCPSYLE